jgi:N-acetylmuramoyl-L-alanine amidase
MTQLIREGTRSAGVVDIQVRLRALGFEIVDPPGEFGPTTKEAVRAFQQQRQILVDGIVGPNTWNEIVEASWRLGDRSLYLARPPMRGDDVLALQARLNAMGFVAGREDGIFGRNTDEAVRAFQREYGVQEDGIFGPRSHAGLIGLRIDRPGTAAHLREELRRAERTGLVNALVVIDPGHGGSDLGDRSTYGAFEADLCWDLASRLAERLAGTGARVRFTRTEAEGPEASERARRANQLGADIVVSLHLNSHPETTAEGASSYYFGGSRMGEQLAESIRSELIRLGLEDCRSHPRSYPILKETRMPAVLVEPAFVTNPDDAKRLEDADFRGAICDAVVAGIRRFYDLGSTTPG